MFELSPLETATNASASLMPASSRTSRSNPSPTIVLRASPGGYLMNASGFLSMTVDLVTAFDELQGQLGAHAPATHDDDPHRPQSLLDACDGRHVRLARPDAERSSTGRAATSTCGYRPSAFRMILPAGAVVQDPLTELREVPARHHDGHLGPVVRDPQHILLERAGHVAVPALDERRAGRAGPFGHPASASTAAFGGSTAAWMAQTSVAPSVCA